MAETTMEELNIEEFEKKEEIVFFKEEILFSSTLEAKGNNGYPCNDCEYVASRVDHLKRHVETKHIGKRYACDKCDVNML